MAHLEKLLEESRRALLDCSTRHRLLSMLVPSNSARIGKRRDERLDAVVSLWAILSPISRRMPGLLFLTLLFVAWPIFGSAAEEIVIASYNLENYIGAESPPGPAPARPARPKSEKSAAAVTHVIQEISPDILGICEMGSPEQFTAFQERLRVAGLEYPHTEYVRAIDPERHLALLSRFPIVERHSQTNLTFDLAGAPHKMARGILDVTIRVQADYDLRLLGVHLKSKLAAPEGEALIRRHEAELLRQYIDAILAAAPETNLLLYGDFNDYKNEASIQTITGPRGAPGHLSELPAADAAGERWTHHGKPADLYARIDFLFAGPALVHEIASGTNRIYSGADWAEASDHRAIYTTIVPVNRTR